MKHDSSCILLASKFLVCLAANVLPNPKVNYFLDNIVNTLGEIFIQKEIITTTTNNNIDTNNTTTISSNNNITTSITTNITTTNNNNENKNEIEVYIMILLTYLIPLHPTHASIIMKHSSNIIQNIIYLLNNNLFSEAGNNSSILLLNTLCYDINIKIELKKLITIENIHNKMSIYTPTVTEKATKLFLSLYSEDIECNYRPRSCYDITTTMKTSFYFNNNNSSSKNSLYNSSNNNSLNSTPKKYFSKNNSNNSNINKKDEKIEINNTEVKHEKDSEKQELNPSPTNFSMRSDCSYSITSVTCLKDLLEIVLVITENALQNNNNNNNEMNNKTENETESINENENSGAAFHYMNSIIYFISLHIKLNYIITLHDIIARIVSLILAQFNNILIFNMNNIKIIDTLLLLLGIQEKCWNIQSTDLIDSDYLTLSPVLIEHFMSLADPIITDSADDKTLPLLYKSNYESSTSQVLNSKIMKYAQVSGCCSGCSSSNYSSSGCCCILYYCCYL